RAQPALPMGRPFREAWGSQRHGRGAIEVRSLDGSMARENYADRPVVTMDARQLQRPPGLRFEPDDRHGAKCGGERPQFDPGALVQTLRVHIEAPEAEHAGDRGKRGPSAAPPRATDDDRS